MSQINNLENGMPSKQHTFFVDVEGQLTKKRYRGEFTCRIPNIKDQCFISKHKAFLNGDYAQFLDAGTIKMHHMISYLRYTLMEFPKFWKESDLGYELMDVNVIQNIYDQVLKFESDWIKVVWGEEATKFEEPLDESGPDETKE